MRNAGLDELQAGIKIGGRNFNNFRYVDDTTLMAETEEELKSPLMRVKEERERASLKLNIKKKKKTKIMASSPITSWQTGRETVTDLIFLSPTKAMAPHSSTLAWKIPWTEEPGRLQSMGSGRVRHD